MIGGYGFRSYPNFNSRDRIFPRVHDPERGNRFKGFRNRVKARKKTVSFYSNSDTRIYVYIDVQLSRQMSRIPILTMPVAEC